VRLTCIVSIAWDSSHMKWMESSWLQSRERSPGQWPEQSELARACAQRFTILLLESTYRTRYYTKRCTYDIMYEVYVRLLSRLCYHRCLFGYWLSSLGSALRHAAANRAPSAADALPAVGGRFGCKSASPIPFVYRRHAQVVIFAAASREGCPCVALSPGLF
jgi:hypothetical protein